MKMTYVKTWSHSIVFFLSFIQKNDEIRRKFPNDVTRADEDTNLILTDNANRAFQDNVPMQVTQPGTNAIDIVWWSNFELICNKSEKACLN